MLAVLIALLTISCNESSNESKNVNTSHDAEQKQLRVAYIENASCWPFFIAMDKNIFNRLGINIIPEKANNSTEALNALLGGKVDISVENTYSVLFAIESKSPGRLKLFLPCSETKAKYVSHILVSKDSNIMNVNEIRGKRIGTYTGATQLLTLKLFLKEHLNLDPERDVDIIQVSPALQVQALRAGQFDVLFTIEPFATAALAKGIARDILPYARGKILDPFPAGASSTTLDTLNARKDVLAKFYRGLLNGAEYIEKNPVESRASLAKWTTLDEKTIAKVGGYKYYSFDEFSAVEKSNVQKLADLYYTGDLLNEKIDVENLFSGEQSFR